MIKILKYEEVSYEEIFSRNDPTANVSDTVKEIIADVRANGDRALFAYCERFDGARLSSLEVSEAEIEEAVSLVEPKFLDILREAAENIRRFHSAQKRNSFIINEKDGVIGANVTQTLYKGNYNQVQVYTDTDEDFYVDTTDDWDINDRVGIKINPNKLTLEKITEEEAEEE